MNKREAAIGHRGGIKTAGLGPMLAVLAILGGAWLWSQWRGEAYFTADGEAMGTTWSVSIDLRGLDQDLGGDLDGLPSICAAHFERLEGIFSTWRGDSQLSRLNRGEALAGGAEELAEILSFAERVSAGNEAFLDFELQDALLEYGFELPEDGGDQPGPAAALRYNLSAIVKGYAVDGLSQALAERGYPDSLVELGGEIALRCHHRQDDWRIAIAHPHWPGRAVATETLELCNQSVATSGDYHNTSTVDGRLVSHLIDPQSRRPKQNRTRSVSVVADSAMIADAYATAFSVSGLGRSDEVSVLAPVRALFLIEDDAGDIKPVWKSFSPTSHRHIGDNGASEAKEALGEDSGQPAMGDNGAPPSAEPLSEER